MPVWARGLSPSGCNKDARARWRDRRIGGVAVRPGDVSVADRDGVAVVPLETPPSSALIDGCGGARTQRLTEIGEGMLIRPEIDEGLRRAGVTIDRITSSLLVELQKDCGFTRNRSPSFLAWRTLIGRCR